MTAQKIVTEACITGADVRDIERSAVKLGRILTERIQDQDAVIDTIPSLWAYQDSITYLVEDLIMENAVNMWTGESGDGKSTLALALAAAVAQGQPS
jgi:RecA-family ATPase